MNRAAVVFVKWVLVPFGLAAIGYFVLGPLIGQGAVPGSRTVKRLAGEVGVAPPAGPVAPADPAAPAADAPRFPEPDVTVAVVAEDRVRWTPGAGGDPSVFGLAPGPVEDRPRREQRPPADEPAPVPPPTAPIEEAPADAGSEAPPAEAEPPAEPPADSGADDAGAGGTQEPPAAEPPVDGSGAGGTDNPTERP